MARYVKPLAHQGDQPWDTGASKYSDGVGHATRYAATRFVEIINARLSLETPEACAIDLAAGTGSQTLALADRFPELPIVAADISTKMLDELRLEYERKHQDPATAKVATQIVDIQKACEADPTLTSAFTHAVSCFAIQIVLDPTGAVNSMYQLLRPGIGAVAAIGFWDFAHNCDPHDLWEEAAKSVNPDYVPPTRNITNRILSADEVEEEMKKAGFQDVRSEIVKCTWGRQEPGSQSYTEWFFEAQNPFALERMSSWEGDLSPVRTAMQRIEERKVGSGKKITVDTGLVVGTRP